MPACIFNSLTRIARRTNLACGLRFTRLRQWNNCPAHLGVTHCNEITSLTYHWLACFLTRAPPP